MINENEFYNKNIVITGASSGIGLSAAIYFMNCNANLILVCRDKESMEKICKKNNFLNAIIIKANLVKKEEIECLLSFITKLFPSIDILINCAGIKWFNDIEKTHEEDFNFTINTNLTSVFLIIKELRPYFSPEGASIINLSCLYGTRPMCGVISYAMSKAGLETLTRYAAAEYANLNIRINAISACPVDTNSFRYADVPEDEIRYFNKKMEDNIPLGRIAEVDDIVKVIIFLASKRSSKITGQIIKVDGGRSLTSSGYVHYKGMRNMNTFIEPDYVNIKNVFEKYFKQNEKILEKPITDKDELKKFVEETISQSNFIDRSFDAHFSILSNYYPVKDVDSLLTSKFLKGSVPNTLLEKKGNTFGTMSYNPFKSPLEENIRIDKKMFNSQIDKGNFQEDNNSFDFKKLGNLEDIIISEENNYKNEENKSEETKEEVKKQEEAKAENNEENNEEYNEEDENNGMKENNP